MEDLMEVLMKRIALYLAAAGLMALALLVDSQPPTHAVGDGYQSVWAPVVTSNCGIWSIRQSPAALEDVWRTADHMTVDGYPGSWAADDAFDLPRGGDELTFRWFDDEQQLLELGVKDEADC